MKYVLRIEHSLLSREHLELWALRCVLGLLSLSWTFVFFRTVASLKQGEKK